MKPSAMDDIRELYEATADGYADMMDSEIYLPLYAETMGRLRDAISHVPGCLLDVACGSGHMLRRYHEEFDPTRPLVGVDLSPRMVEIATGRLPADAIVMATDMRELDQIEPESAAAVLSFFALHHIDPVGSRAALREWHRVLAPEGRVFVATWEGTGPIDYGGEAEIVALKHAADDLATWVREGGFRIDRCVVEPVEGMEMDAVYLDATRMPDR